MIPKKRTFNRLLNKKQNANSTNSAQVSEMLSDPNERDLTVCLAKALASMVCESHATVPSGPFDERLHPLKKTLKKGMPTTADIYHFVRIIYKRTNMHPECITMTLSYLKHASTLLTQFTWKHLCLAALIVANKVFEDAVVWNADFLSLFPDTDIESLNTLEREFLILLDFKASVKSSEYAQCYFTLRDLSE